MTLEQLAPRATGKLRELLDTAAPTKSRLERRLRRLLREHGLPQATKGQRTVPVTHAQLEQRATTAERFAVLLSSRAC